MSRKYSLSNARWFIDFSNFRITAPPLWLAVVLPLSFFAAATLSLSAFGANTPIWVSNAIAVTALLRNKRSTWPVLIVLEAAAGYAASVINGTPIIGLGIVACNSVEILLIAMLAGFGVASPLENIWSLTKFALICLLVPTVSATGGAGLLSIAYGARFFAAWKTWYLADICGLLTITPLLLSWTDPAIRTQNLRGPVVQAVVFAGVIAGVTYFDFHDGLPDSFLAFPILLVATFNGSLVGATTGAVAEAAVAIWSTMTGSGDFAAFAKTDPVLKVQLLQMYIAISLLLVLPVAAVLEQLRERTREVQAAALGLEESRHEAVFMLGEAGHYNDDDTGAHNRRVAAYGSALAAAAGWPAHLVQRLELAAPLHDTGKINTPDAILKAPRKLHTDEWKIMQRHAEIGYAILSKSKSPLFAMAAEIARYHHEKWDGTGYPAGLRGEAIPEAARIIALVDFFDALTSNRPYKDAWTVVDTMAEIRKGSGNHFEPRLVELFERILPELVRIKDEAEAQKQKESPRYVIDNAVSDPHPTPPSDGICKNSRGAGLPP
jgi:HD-GYP domain-containing protein (c-di-GMP phosphodiesterase class II)